MERNRQVIAGRADGSVVEGWKPQREREAVELYKERGESLTWFLRLASMPEPADDGAWRQLVHDMYWFYRHALPASPPILGDEERVQWAQEVFSQVHALWETLKSERSISVPIEWGAQHFRIDNGRLVPSYIAHDPPGALLLAFVEQLASLDDISRIRPCRRCSMLFLKVKRKEYCGKACKEKARAHSPSRDRTKAYRKRRRAWNSARATLERALESMRTLYQTTERQALERTENALTRAARAFHKAFPRKAGQDYKEGEQFLASVCKQMKQLRKKMKGY